MGLHEVFYKILDEYQDVYEQIWVTNNFKHELLTYFNTKGKQTVYQAVLKKNRNLIVNSSTGRGKTTKTPWIAVFDTRVTSKASEGTYIVYLFNKDEKCVYLSLEQSIDGAKKQAKDTGASGKKVNSITNEILNNEKLRVLNLIDSGSFLTDKDISTGKIDFDITDIMYKKYSIHDMPDDDSLEKDLYELIDIYEQYYNRCVVKNKEIDLKNDQVLNILKEKAEQVIYNKDENDKIMILNKDITEYVDKIHKNILGKGYVYSIELIKNFYLSLKSKPFVILAGISGTGKSKLVKLFAEAIGAKIIIIPVRPDWSDSTDLFGHLDLEGKFIEGPVTKFIADANIHLNTPHILCLDEMNLARVEYYFSDFLSVIETRQANNGHIVTDKLLPESAFGNDINAKAKFQDLMLSENLYIVGTVNMDETTFPFSKKVLDRANTIEFSDVHMHLGLTTDVNTGKSLSFKADNSFLKSEYLNIASCYKIQEITVNRVVDLLSRVNESLKKINAQVAYRVRNEISYYVVYSQQYKLMNLNEALDNALLQKILPRIQGSTMAIKVALSSLFEIAVGTKISAIQKNDNEVGESMQKYLDEITERKETGQNIINVDYPRSATKIAFMMRRFQDDGYTSYWL